MKGAPHNNPPVEGVIQFAYDLQPADGAPISNRNFAQMAAWRSILRQLELLGQDLARYDGLGFGNLSARDPQQPKEFVITASQSSGREVLTEESLVRVLHCNLGRFWVDAQGSQPPSSETLTHGMIYAADSEIHWVFHAHSPEIWTRAEDLALPCTPENVSYGTPGMTAAVAQLLRRHRSRPILFATLGHEDGVFACGATAEEAGALLVSTLSAARAGA
jgi:ribulose-5-phosphate 4-epimerase/fuculose-1-phosphate aldolase